MGRDGASILVVEDDPSLSMVYRVTLELERFSVRDARTLEAAHAAIAAERPALVLLDVHLEGTSSDALLEQLRCDGIPVVIVSGTADLNEYAERASAVLAKPFDPGELVALARKHALG